MPPNIIEQPWLISTILPFVSMRDLCDHPAAEKAVAPQAVTLLPHELDRIMPRPLKRLARRQPSG